MKDGLKIVYKMAVIVLLLVLLFSSEVFAFCFEEAGSMYGISPQILWAIAKVESNFNPLAVNYNSNGSYDFGVMQINSSWYRVIKNLWPHLSDPCTNVKVGAWILAQCISKHGYTWDAVGCYNAKSKHKASRYARKVYSVLARSNIDLKN